MLSLPPGCHAHGRGCLNNIGEWWNSIHTFSGDAHNLSIDGKAMGCFCEKLPSGGSARHIEVVYADPGKRLVFRATGSMTIQLTAAGEGTKLTVVYTVTDYLPAGMNTWAAPVDSVLSDRNWKSRPATGSALRPAVAALHERYLADALAGCSKDRIAHRRQNRRQSRLTQSRRRIVGL